MNIPLTDFSLPEENIRVHRSGEIPGLSWKYPKPIFLFLGFLFILLTVSLE